MTVLLYCCIWIGGMTEVCFIKWFICIYTRMIHLFYHVLHPRIRYRKHLFHCTYPTWNMFRYVLHPQIAAYETSVSLYIPVHETCISLYASSIYTCIWNISVCFIHRYPCMKHVSLCASSTYTLRQTCFIMCSSTYEADPALNSLAYFWLAVQRQQDVKWTYASFDVFTEDVNLVKISLLVLCWTVVKDD
jgi:hypothetical protein